MFYGLFLASGATGLVFLVAWMRDLSLVFGASFEARSIVLATFMAGLAAGGFSFGRRAHRLTRLEFARAGRPGRNRRLGHGHA